MPILDKITPKEEPKREVKSQAKQHVAKGGDVSAKSDAKVATKTTSEKSEQEVVVPRKIKIAHWMFPPDELPDSSSELQKIISTFETKYCRSSLEFLLDRALGNLPEEHIDDMGDYFDWNRALLKIRKLSK